MEIRQEHIRKHHYHSSWRRGLYSLGLIVFMLFFGTVSMHWIEGFSYMDSFYFTSMIATSQGPPPNISPVSALGKLFTCLIAFISVGSMVAAFGFLFGPFIGKLLHIGATKLEEEIREISNKHEKN